MADTGYINGSDLLLKVSGKPVGHCSSHSITYESETKDHAVKPLATAAKGASLFKGTSVSGLSIQIKFDALRFYGETENGFEQISALWGAGAPVEVESFERGKDSAPVLTGKFIIKSLEENSPAQDDATYSGTLVNDGAPTKYPGMPVAVKA